MKKILKRSRFKRNLVLKSENKKKIYKSISLNNNVIKTLRWNADLNSSNRSLGTTQLTNRCLITGRKNIFSKPYKLSRIIFLKYARKGFIPDLTKST